MISKSRPCHFNQWLKEENEERGEKQRTGWGSRENWGGDMREERLKQ